jgi:hypothetical protein
MPPKKRKEQAAATVATGLLTLSGALWTRIQRMVEDAKLVFTNENPKDTRAVKKTVRAKIREMKEADRNELQQSLSEASPNLQRALEILKGANIVRANLRGKKEREKEEDDVIEEAAKDVVKTQEEAEAEIIRLMEEDRKVEERMDQKTEPPQPPPFSPFSESEKRLDQKTGKPKSKAKVSKKGIMPPGLKKATEERVAKKEAIEDERFARRTAGLAREETVKRVEAKIDTLSEAKISAIRTRLTNELKASFVDADLPNTIYPGLQLDSKTVSELIDTIPEGNRATLGRAVRGLLGNNLSLNSIVSGLVGLQVGLMTNPSAGVFASGLINQVFDNYGINLNQLLADANPYALSPDEKIGEPQPFSPFSESEKRMDQKTGTSTIIRPPTAEEVTSGAQAGMIAGGVSGLLSSGSAMVGASTIIPAAIGGAAVGALTGPTLDDMIERHPSLSGLSQSQKKMIKAMPPIAIAALLGYSPPGSEPIGTGIVSGAGITESKLKVPQSVIESTMAQVDQTGANNKIWQPKSISPTTDILNETKQERYADDIEFIAFNYIAPTSEGAAGTVDTNPLKASQARGDAIRYTDSGIFIPYMLWNKDNFNEDTTAIKLDKLALGPELPEMVFIEQDNADTFAEEAEFQFANGENTAIGFLSPYSDFSNVDNFWSINETSELYTINS